MVVVVKALAYVSIAMVYLAGLPSQRTLIIIRRKYREPGDGHGAWTGDREADFLACLFVLKVRHGRLSGERAEIIGRSGGWQLSRRQRDFKRQKLDFPGPCDALGIITTATTATGRSGNVRQRIHVVGFVVAVNDDELISAVRNLDTRSFQNGSELAANRVR